MSINLFVAPAGYGSRLRPVTSYLPKPMLPVAGVSVIDRMIDRVSASVDVDSIGINTHYKSESFKSWRPEVEQFYELELLGTGGALWNASEFFERKTCLLINGDVLTDFNWQEMLNLHRSSGNLVTLAVQDRSHERRVGVGGEGELICIDKDMKDPRPKKWYGYACVALYEPGFLKYLPEGESHVVPYWVAASEAGEKIGVYDIGAEKQWEDLGNLQSYAEGILSYLNGETRFYAEMLKMPWDLKVSGFCVVENDVLIGQGVSLENVIILPGTTIKKNSVIKNSVVGPGFSVQFKLPLQTKFRHIKKIGEGGSDRVYQRLNEGVLLNYSAVETNIERQKTLTKELIKAEVKVPKIYWHKPIKRQVLLEDLGDQTFRKWSIGKNESQIDKMVKSILGELTKFQSCEIKLNDKIFNESVLNWETGYFIERFVYRYCGMREYVRENEEELTQERKKLAQAVNNQAKYLMHRDFQSENVMIHNDKPWIIDFQAAHLGSPLYDAASFIGDPYMDYDKIRQEKFKKYYFNLLENFGGFDNSCLEEDYIQCSLQRHMQALGAYCFLCKIKGLNHFEKFIMPAFEMLRSEFDLMKNKYPFLNELIGVAAKKL